jgi:hypothetical protein
MDGSSSNKTLSIYRHVKAGSQWPLTAPSLPNPGPPHRDVEWYGTARPEHRHILPRQRGDTFDDVFPYITGLAADDHITCSRGQQQQEEEVAEEVVEEEEQQEGVGMS